MGCPKAISRSSRSFARIIDRGEAEGSFRPGIDPVTLHMNMTALSFYNVSNQFTFAHNFGVDMSSAEAVERRAPRGRRHSGGVGHAALTVADFPFDSSITFASSLRGRQPLSFRSLRY